jgi:hypothetical protein
LTGIDRTVLPGTWVYECKIMSEGLNAQERRALLLLAKKGEEGVAEDRLVKVHRLKMPVLIDLATRGYIRIQSRRFQGCKMLSISASVHITEMGKAAIAVYKGK